MRFSKFILSGLAALLLGCQTKKDIPITHLPRPVCRDSRIDSFPNKMPGAAEVRKYAVPDSKHCLVHILQTHIIPFSQYNIFHYGKVYNDYERINNVQKDIYTILSYLHDTLSINSVYSEGIHERNWRTSMDKESAKEKLSLHIKLLTNELAKIESDIQSPFWMLAKHQELISDAEKYEYIGGANFKLYLEGKIEIEQGEFRRIFEISDAHAQDRKGKETVFDVREDALVELTSKSKNFFTVAQYGGAHAFGGKESCGQNYSMHGRFSYRDNIADFNRLNPDNKFSLIEIIPEFSSSIYIPSTDYVVVKVPRN